MPARTGPDRARLHPALSWHEARHVMHKWFSRFMILTAGWWHAWQSVCLADMVLAAPSPQSEDGVASDGDLKTKLEEPSSGVRVRGVQSFQPRLAAHLRIPPKPRCYMTPRKLPTEMGPWLQYLAQLSTWHLTCLHIQAKHPQNCFRRCAVACCPAVLCPM